MERWTETVLAWERFRFSSFQCKTVTCRSYYFVVMFVRLHCNQIGRKRTECSEILILWYIFHVYGSRTIQNRMKKNPSCSAFERCELERNVVVVVASQVGRECCAAFLFPFSILSFHFIVRCKSSFFSSSHSPNVIHSFHFSTVSGKCVHIVSASNGKQQRKGIEIVASSYWNILFTPNIFSFALEKHIRSNGIFLLFCYLFLLMEWVKEKSTEKKLLTMFVVYLRALLSGHAHYHGRIDFSQSPDFSIAPFDWNKIMSENNFK